MIANILKSILNKGETSMGLLNGKVAIVTGAGGGLGRTHALALAKEGAKVVVNDVGGSRDGSGTGSAMASQVAEEIKKLGGEAVANFDSVADAAGAERIIKTAIDTFGRLDILVNNAGILRDKTLLKMEDEQWKLVLAVHLDGTFYCGRAAARYMVENNIAGKIINTTSYSGLKGNYGQGNYGAAKAGIVALTKIWALELAKAGITVNAIAPMAKTRMTEDIAAVPEDVKPEHVSPIVTFLASDLSKDVNGRVFGVHGRHIFEYKTEITDGVKPEVDWTPSEIAAKLDAISANAQAAAPAAASSGAASGVGARIKRAFDLMETAFTPDKAAGWNAIIHFLIESADSYTLTIKDKKCTVQNGVHNQPTCKVNTSADTMASMIEGKISGQQAFMAGKIKANNLGDMMKFGKVFDFKRAREAAAKNPAAATATAPVNQTDTASASASAHGTDTIDVASVFNKLGDVFLPDQSSGWNGKIAVDVEGTAGWTVTIENRKCTVNPGKESSVACTVTTTAADFAKVLGEKLDLNAASSKGLLKASNPMALIKFNRAFDWKSPKLTAALAKEATAEEGLSASAVGRKYRSSATFVKPDRLKAYAAATNDPNLRFQNGDAPPVFPVTLVGDLFRQMLGDDLGIDLTRMVHGEQTIQYFRPLKAWDLVTPRGAITQVEKKGHNDILRFEQNLYKDGELATRILTSLVIRGQGSGKSEAQSTKKTEESAAPAGTPDFTHTVAVTADQPARYAEASGDNNPIHLDATIAKAAGFPSVILHGLCTMAFAGQAIVEKALGGDPGKLTEISVRFSKPVFPGDKLTIQGFSKGDGALAFTAVNQNGVTVISQGTAKTQAAATKSRALGVERAAQA